MKYPNYEDKKKFTVDTELHPGDYFRAHKSKYIIYVKEVGNVFERNWSKEEGEYSTQFYVVDIYDRSELLLAANVVVTHVSIISGALAKYIVEDDFPTTCIGNADVDANFVAYELWINMIRSCFDPHFSTFPFIGALGTTVCDRWRCFEYFVADMRHCLGYAAALENINFRYAVDIYDIQKKIKPSNRVYGPGLCQVKPFKESDAYKYINAPKYVQPPRYPSDMMTTTGYRNGSISLDNLYNKHTGINYKLDLETGKLSIGIICPSEEVAYNTYKFIPGMLLEIETNESVPSRYFRQRTMCRRI